MPALPPTHDLLLVELGSCCECGRTWLDPTERWHVRFAVGGEEVEGAPQTVLVCPQCAASGLSSD